MNLQINKTYSFVTNLTFIFLLTCCGAETPFHSVYSSQDSTIQKPQSNNNIEKPTQPNRDHVEKKEVKKEEQPEVTEEQPEVTEEQQNEPIDTKEERIVPTSCGGHISHDSASLVDTCIRPPKQQEIEEKPELESANEKPEITEMSAPVCRDLGRSSGWYQEEQLLRYDNCEKPRKIVCIEEPSKMHPFAGYYIENGTPYGELILKGNCKKSEQ